MHLHLVPAVIELVLQAGELIAREAERPGGPRGAGDKAEIDVEVEQWLRAGLLRLLPCDFVGEETGVQRSGAATCWVVDPNDGTADFLRTGRGSAVSVGLLDHQQPVLGVVYAPVSAQGPDCIAWAQGAPGLWRNGTVITPQPPRALAGGAAIFVSAAAADRLELNNELCAPGHCHPMTSIAYRLARVAAGDGAAAISLYPVAPHDVVAGHALLRAVGGDLFDHHGQAIRYAHDGYFEGAVLGCFGGAAATCQELSRRDWQRLVPGYWC
ncbi:inositol monophosphatase [Pseudomonas sp. QE6]|uniref:inositol monophosphatase family protein n=1 Tax=Pseudomonas sp. QE6 TaxID=3242491 RepID=UPI003528341B